MSSAPFSFALALAIVGGALVVLLVGAALVWRGWRGRRVDDHPLCRRCRFNLSGAPAGSGRCPECGADVRAARAVVVGHRQRRAGFIVAGAVLLLTAGAPIVAVGVAAVRGTDRLALEPTWYLLHEARGTLPATPDRAIAELLSRASAGKLDAEGQLRLAALLIDRQRDRSRPWNPAWGDWLATKATDGSLPTAERDRFFKNLVDALTIDLRGTQRQGAWLRIRFSFDQRDGGMTGLAYGRPDAVRGEVDSGEGVLLIDGQPAANVSSGHASRIRFFGKQTMGTIAEHAAWLAVATGTHDVVWTVPIRLVHDVGGREVELLIVPVTRRARIVVVEADAPEEADVRRVADESLRPAMRAAFRPTAISLSSGGNSAMLHLNYTAAFPADVAFDMFARQNGQEHQLGVITAATSAGRPDIAGMGVHAEGLVPGTAEVILRPSARAARDTVDVFTIWDGELRYADVPVK